MDALEGLNDAQRQAATAGDGPLLIIAGPGTGKTKTLTARVLHLIAAGQAQSSQILALTFTKKATEEMQARIDLLLLKSALNATVQRTADRRDGRGGPLSRASTASTLWGGSAARPPHATEDEAKTPQYVNDAPKISTFHALCFDFLGGNFQFAEEPVRLQIIKKLPKPPALKSFSARELALRISRYKNMADDDSAVALLAAAYDDALAMQNMVDFDDLLVKTRDMLKRDDAKRAAVQNRYKYILVDEFQDTNLLQYELLRLIAGQNQNVFVIGDPNQSIYGFRGASGDIFGLFQKDFPGAAVITLGNNYRSTPEVVRLGNAVFPDGPQLKPQTLQAGRVRTIEVLNEYSEANWVLAEIQRAVGGGDFLHAVSDGNRDDEVSLRDFAILYRNRSAAAAVQKTIADSGLPYQVVGDGSPYEQPQVQIILALLTASQRQEQPQHEGFSQAEWRRVLELIQPQRSEPPHQLAEKVIATLGFAPSPELQQFTNVLVRFADVSSALRYFGDIAESGFYDAHADAVTLLTIHASKGLEFPHVFLIGAEKGILPHEKANRSEERRLFYVAATRAKHSIDILYARRRGGKPVERSCFISELPDAVLPKTTDPNLAADQRRAQKHAVKRSQQQLF